MNRRDVKKDINFLVSEVITEAYTASVMFSKIKEEDVTAIINDALEMRNQMLTRVNNIEGKDDPKKVKAHYRQLYTDLMGTTTQLLDRCGQLTK